MELTYPLEFDITRQIILEEFLLRYYDIFLPQKIESVFKIPFSGETSLVIRIMIQETTTKLNVEQILNTHTHTSLKCFLRLILFTG